MTKRKQGDEARRVQALNKKKRLAAYYENPKRCPQCDDPIDYYMRNKAQCCSRICSGYRMHGLEWSKKSPRPCPNCGKSVGGKSRNIHCSMECKTKAEWDDRKSLYESAGEIVGGDPRQIRKYLFDTRERKCEICGTAEWRAQRVPLIADHINGDPENHSLANLRLICPNCDAQLPTSKGRNKGNGRRSRREAYRPVAERN